MSEKFILNRMGLVNFWYYQNQTFELSEGHLLLRGSNGAGKSVTMQSLLPVLLDGNTNANRLDSFGSQDRNMKDYLLGEKDVSGKEEATGYLWAEYQKGSSFITTGIGLHSRRNGNLTHWYFVIENDRRVNKDFSLLTNETNSSATALSKVQLRNRLGNGGIIFENRQGYADYVRKRIFGFSSRDDFNDTIRLMIQLRNPKLNRSFKPIDLENILSDSLPSLSDDNVQASAQTLNQIDEANKNIAESRNQKQALQPLLVAFNKYRRDQLSTIFFFAKARLQKVATLNKSLSEVNFELKSIQQTEDDLRTQIDRNDADIQASENLKDELSHNEGFDLVDKGTKLQNKLQKTKSQSNEKKKYIENDKNTIDKIKKKKSSLNTQKGQLENQLSDIKVEANIQASKSGYSKQHHLFLSLRSTDDQIDFEQWKNEIQTFRHHLEDAIDLFVKVENKQKNLDDLDKTLTKDNQEMSKMEMDKRDWDNQYVAELFDMKEKFKSYCSSLNFEVSLDIIGKIQSNLDKIYTDSMPDLMSVTVDLNKSFNKEISKLDISMSKLNVEIKDISIKITNLIDEQEKIKAQKYPVPERTEARALRRAKNVQGIPLYQLIDFNDNLPSEVSNKLEGALLESGILDALVTTNEELIVGDSKIVAAPLTMKATLAEYLHPDLDTNSIISENQVLNILNSISIEKDIDAQAIVTSDGYFKVGLLEGTTDLNYDAQFIGSSAQKRYREKAIKEIQNQIDSLKDNKDELAQRLEDDKARQHQVLEDQKKMPSDKDLHQLKYNFDVTLQKIERQQKIIDNLSKKLESVQNDLQKTRYNLNLFTKEDSLTKSKSAYKDGRNVLELYLTSIMNWNQILRDIENISFRLTDADDRLNQTNEQLSQKQFEFEQITKNIQELEFSIRDNLEQQKNAGDLNKIKEQLEGTIDRLRKLHKEQEESQKKLLSLTSLRTLKQQDAKRYQVQLKFETPFSGLVNQTNEYELQREVDQGKYNRDDLVEQLIKNGQPNSDQLNKDIESLTTKFNKYSGSLLEFRPQQLSRSTMEEPSWLNDFSDYSEVDFWRRNLNVQSDLVVELGGVNRLINVLDDSLNKQIEINSEVMKEQDERLFKTIIFEGLGNIIRQRINKAQEWVDKINNVLKQQENNSNLKLNIEWKIKPSDERSDADNIRVVELFKRDANTLSQQDLDKMKSFLNDKIQSRKNDYQEDNKTIQMTTILREALDYRDWFQFRLFYTQIGKNKRPLTSAVFNRFSSGEKAVTMYTPLFVAMSARYDNANDSAPKIITLDEAFAGIDERNISELFKTIGRLNFNYVMNSQQLQAEYSTVSSLNTYELLRPQGEDGNIVTTIKMHWDSRK